MKTQRKDIIVIGFALFAMFFGAGNMIFPPYLGLETGSQWGTGFLSFTFADAGLALLTILAMVCGAGSLEGMTHRLGKWSGILLSTSIFLCVGPLMAIPRTAASTYELGFEPVFHGGNIFFSILFFAVVFILTIRPSAVVDIIGKFLTPALFIALLVMIGKGIITPVGDVLATGAQDVFAKGIKAGYQTMDVFGAIIFTVLVTGTLDKSDYSNKKRIGIVIRAGIVAAVGLSIVYGGLAYLGASATSLYDTSVTQTQLLVGIVKHLMGSSGIILLGITVALACLTTAIGLTSAAAAFFSEMTHGKVPYGAFIGIICAFSCVVSNFGINTIIAFSTPILSVVYPATLTLVFLSFFDKKIKNDNVYRFATVGALIMSVLAVLDSYGVKIAFLKLLPMDKFGFGWVVPTILCGVIGFMIKPGGKKEIKSTTRAIQSES